MARRRQAEFPIRLRHLQHGGIRMEVLHQSGGASSLPGFDEGLALDDRRILEHAHAPGLVRQLLSVGKAGHPFRIQDRLRQPTQAVAPIAQAKQRPID